MARQLQDEAVNRDVLLAFRVEQFRRMEHVDVRRFLVGAVGREANRPQTLSEMRQVLEQFSATYGIPIRKVKRRQRAEERQG